MTAALLRTARRRSPKIQKKRRIEKMGILLIITIVVAILAISFLWSAGIVWLLCWGLNALGVYTIGPVAVAFSWPLVLVFWLVHGVLAGIFRTTVKKSE
jgi:flagellar biosynthesis protein FliP